MRIKHHRQRRKTAVVQALRLSHSPGRSATLARTSNADAGGSPPGSLLIYATKPLDAAGIEFMSARGLTLPPDATTGGRIIGQVQVAAFVRDAASPWAEPDMWHWLLADNPGPAVPPIACRGLLRQFDPPAGWQTSFPEEVVRQAAPRQSPNAHAGGRYPQLRSLRSFGHERSASSEHHDVPIIGQICDRMPNRQPSYAVLRGQLEFPRQLVAWYQAASVDVRAYVRCYL
jgi:hypothetical protein